jgi:integrase
MPIRRRGPWWHYRFTIAGQEYTGSTELRATEASRKAAERFERTQFDLAKQGRLAEARKDFATAAGEFIVWCKDVEYRAKPNTAERIGVSFASLVAFFGDVHVVSIGAGDIERYKTHRIQVNAVKDVTLRHDLHSLSLFFQYAERMRWREGNPVRQVSIPSDAEAVRIHPPSAAEEEAYFKAAFNVIDRAGRRNLYDVAKAIRQQGCRPEEIMSSRKPDLDPNAGTLAIPGGKSRAAKRVLYLTPEILEILAARLKTEGPWLFPSERYPGNHITKFNNSHDRACRDATAAWKTELEKAGRYPEARDASVSFVLYDLRHAFGTYQATVLKTDPFTLAALMGHANLRTIMRYVHPDQHQQKEAMERYVAAMGRKSIRRVK